MAFLTMEPLAQPVATGRNGFCLFLRFAALGALPVIAAYCNHGLHRGSIPKAANASLRLPISRGLAARRRGG